MKIKVFTKDKDGKISFTPDELKELLDEAYWEGYRANSNIYTYRTPNWQPYYWTGTTREITLNATNTTNGAIDASNLTHGTIGAECNITCESKEV